MLWPTPAAMVPNDNEPPEEWLARQERLKENSGQGFAMPLNVAVKVPEEAVTYSQNPGKARRGMWPTPQAFDQVEMVRPKEQRDAANGGAAT